MKKLTINLLLCFLYIFILLIFFNKPSAYGIACTATAQESKTASCPLTINGGASCPSNPTHNDCAVSTLREAPNNCGSATDNGCALTGRDPFSGECYYSCSANGSNCPVTYNWTCYTSGCVDSNTRYYNGSCGSSPNTCNRSTENCGSGCEGCFPYTGTCSGGTCTKSVSSTGSSSCNANCSQVCVSGEGMCPTGCNTAGNCTRSSAPAGSICTQDPSCHGVCGPDCKHSWCTCPAGTACYQGMNCPLVCNGSGNCTNSAGYPAMCSGTCGCQAGQTACGSTCCDAGQTCNGGTCQTPSSCQAGQTACGSTCCNSGETCTNGTCQTNPGGGSCFLCDTTTGTCGGASGNTCVPRCEDCTATGGGGGCTPIYTEALSKDTITITRTGSDTYDIVEGVGGSCPATPAGISNVSISVTEASLTYTATSTICSLFPTSAQACAAAIDECEAAGNTNCVIQSGGAHGSGFSCQSLGTTCNTGGQTGIRYSCTCTVTSVQTTPTNTCGSIPAWPHPTTLGCTVGGNNAKVGTYHYTVTVTNDNPRGGPVGHPLTVNVVDSLPTYSISGNVFIDTNKDKTKGGGEANYSGNITISGSGTGTQDLTTPTPSQAPGGGGGNNRGLPGNTNLFDKIINLFKAFAQVSNLVATYPSSGAYTVSGLSAGTYTIQYTNLPTGFQMSYPQNGPPPSFTVTVGPSGCSVGGSNSASCDGSGNISNLNFGINSYSEPWIQSQESDIRVDSGFNNPVPPTAIAQCGGSFTSIPGAGGSPGIIFTGNTTADLGEGQASVRNWIVGGPQYPENFTPARSGIIRTSYAYQVAKAKQAGITPTDLSTVCTLSTCDLPANLPNGLYIANGDLTIAAVPSSYNFSNNKNYVFLVDGDLTIRKKLHVPIGSTVFFSVSGSIYIDPLVGEASYQSSVADLEGIYSADHNFVLQGNNNCAVAADLRLNLEGSVITNASLTGGSFQNNRNMCDNNVYCPVFFIKGRPDFVLNAPNFVRTSIYTWKEVAP